MTDLRRLGYKAPSKSFHIFTQVSGGGGGSLRISLAVEWPRMDSLRFTPTDGIGSKGFRDPGAVLTAPVDSEDHTSSTGS